MDSFIDYMNNIKAEKNLKEITKERVFAELSSGSERIARSAKTKARGKITVRKIVAMAAAAALCMGLATGAYAYYTPVSYVSVDINPSVELGVNTFGRVVKAESYNEDGQKILQNANVKNQSVKDAVSNLVKTAADQGYVASDGTTVVAVTAESDNQNTAAALQQEGESGVGDAIQAKNILAVVYANSSDLELRTEAKALGISPGKYKVIEIMQALDPSIKAADYKDAKMTELIVKADELLDAYKNGTVTTDQQIAFKGVDDAAEKVKNANGKQNKGTETENQNQDQNQGTKTPEQEKEKNTNNGNGNAGGNGNAQNNGSQSPTATPGNNGKSDTAPGNGKDNGNGAKKD